MGKHEQLQIFQTHHVRSVWDDEQEKWYFSVADVVAVLTDSVNPTDYIKKMRKRDPELAKGWGQIVTPLSLISAERAIDHTNPEGMLSFNDPAPFTED